MPARRDAVGAPVAGSRSARPTWSGRRLFEAVVELLSWCSRHRPVLVLLEDLHRADVASMTLLTYVGRRLGDLAALIVATRRNAPESGDLDASIDAFRSRGLMRAEIVLDAMSPEQIEAIIREVAPGIEPDVALRVASIADGNPLLAREAARAAASGGEPFDGIRAAIRTPVRRLPPHARLLVEVAATAGRPLERREAAEAVGAETLDDAFVAASEAGLLDASDRQVRFVHELVRQACYAELPHARREWLHATIADLLIRKGTAGAAEVARHLRLAGDDEAARPQLVIAARQSPGARGAGRGRGVPARGTGDPHRGPIRGDGHVVRAGRGRGLAGAAGRDGRGVRAGPRARHPGARSSRAGIGARRAGASPSHRPLLPPRVARGVPAGPRDHRRGTCRRTRGARARPRRRRMGRGDGR